MINGDKTKKQIVSISGSDYSIVEGVDMHVTALKTIDFTN